MATLGKPAAKKTTAAKTASAAKKTPPARKTTAARKRPAPILFKAPADFKPAFFEIAFESLRDGLIRGGSIKVVRVRGRWDNADAKRYDLADYDQATLLGVASRLGGMAMAPNVTKRLPPKSKYGIIVRVNRRSADGALVTPLKGIKQLVVSGEKAKWKWMTDKTDVTYRKIRKLARALPGAFVEVQLPPSGRRSKKDAEE